MYLNERYKSYFVKKIQIYILMKNTDLVLLKKKIQIYILMRKKILVFVKKKSMYILMKYTNLVLLKNSNLYFNEKCRFGFC